MLLDFLRSLLVFHGVALGLAWPFAARLALAPLERVVASVALSLLGVFVFAWTVYVFALPNALFLALPLLGVAGLALGGRALREIWRDPEARAALIGYLLVAAWCIGWLATIDVYSGGGWAGDWLEHWERSTFFLEHGPLDKSFIGVYPLTARPPLVNVITGALLWLTEVDFAHYQLLSTLLASLVFLPVALLARRFSSPGGATRTIAVLAALFLTSPLVVENATFAWTKLPTACFILASAYFFLRARDPDAPHAAVPLWSAFLATALLAHYSAGPYAVVLAFAWFAFSGGRRNVAWWRATAIATFLGAALLALWFGWSLRHYGTAGTFLSNTSVTTVDSYEGSQLAKIALNLRDTLLPHFFHASDETLIRQTNALGHLRDAWFNCYQLNLPLAFGSIAWLAVLRELWRVGREASRTGRRFWALFVVGVVFLGVATHGARDTWGLTHICLQALVLLGLAFLAARWAQLSGAWRTALIAGAGFDFLLGIALQFGIQSFRLIRWASGGRPMAETIPGLSTTTDMNIHAKFFNHVFFFGEVFGPPLGLVMLLLAFVLITALRRTRAGGSLAVPIAPPIAPLRPERDLPLEGLRGLCACSVLYAHAFAPRSALDPAWAPPAQFWWFNVGYAAVLVFFTLSGYVIGLTTTRAPTRPEVSRYLARRALRLVPINTIAVLLAVAFLPVVNAHTALGNLFFLQNGEAYPGGVKFELLENNTPLWSLNYEVVCYLAFLLVWFGRPSRALAWGTLLFVALISSVGLPDLATISHFACGGLYWLAGLALAWQTAPAGGTRRGNWPAAALGAFALWSLAPLRDLLFDAQWYSFAAVTPAAPHRLDFLPACVWLVAAVTGRAPRLQQVLTWLCLGWGALGLVVRIQGGDFAPEHYAAAAALVTAFLIHRWTPHATGLGRLAPLGSVSFAVYAIALPLQLGQRHLWPAFSGSAITFGTRLIIFLALLFTFAWWLERRFAVWVRSRFLPAPAANFPRESAAPLNSVR